MLTQVKSAAADRVLLRPPDFIILTVQLTDIRIWYQIVTVVLRIVFEPTILPLLIFQQRRIIFWIEVFKVKQILFLSNMSKRAERIKTDFDLRKERTRESKLHGGGRPHYSTKVGFPLYRRMSQNGMSHTVWRSTLFRKKWESIQKTAFYHKSEGHEAITYPWLLGPLLGIAYQCSYLINHTVTNKSYQPF